MLLPNLFEEKRYQKKVTVNSKLVSWKIRCFVVEWSIVLFWHSSRKKKSWIKLYKMYLHSSGKKLWHYVGCLVWNFCWKRHKVSICALQKRRKMCISLRLKKYLFWKVALIQEIQGCGCCVRKHKTLLSFPTYIHLPFLFCNMVCPEISAVNSGTARTSTVHGLCWWCFLFCLSNMLFSLCVSLL